MCVFFNMRVSVSAQVWPRARVRELISLGDHTCLKGTESLLSLTLLRKQAFVFLYACVRVDAGLGLPSISLIELGL